jgi:integrase/recombinase XerD
LANPFKSFLAPQMEQYIEYRQNLDYTTTAVAWLRLFDRYLVMENVTTLKVLTPLFFLKMLKDLAIDKNTINQGD